MKFGMIGRKTRRITTRDRPDPNYEIAYERKRLPDPGAGNFALESHQLFPLTPIGPGVPHDRSIKPATGSPQMISMPTLVDAGIPTVSGGITSSPLFNPQTGVYQSQFEPPNPLPFGFHDVQPAGEAL